MTRSRLAATDGSAAAILGRAFVFAVTLVVACGTDEGDTGRTSPEDAGIDQAGGGGSGGSAGNTVDATAEQEPDALIEAGGEAGAAGASGSGGSGGDLDASDGDAGATPDADAGDASMPEAAVDAPVSQFCGDGVRDPITEECDDGTGSSPPDSCSSDCRVNDVLVLPGPGSDGGTAPPQDRSLGRCRHPIAAGSGGFAVALADTSVLPYTLRLRAFNSNGTPGPTLAVASGSTISSDADPCVAALPGGKYAIVYTDLSGDGDGRGVALRIVDAVSSNTGALVRVNSTTVGNQDQPDAIWTGSELVVAFTDQSKSGNLRDVRLRRFDVNGAAKGGEEVLSATVANEASVALAPFASGWAIAYRSSSGPVNEKVIVRFGSKEWSTENYSFGPTGDRPALAELDSTHLLLAYTVGGTAGVTAGLRGMVIDTQASTAPASFELTPLVPPYSSTPTLGQSQGNVIATGDRLFVAWRSQAVLATVEDEELWLKPLSWSVIGGTPALDLSAVEIALPRSPGHRTGDQQRPALASGSLGSGGAIVTAWDDHAKVFGSVEGLPDVVAELIPLPVVRLAPEGGME